MLSTLARKFTFFYWITFLSVVIPFYLFGTYYVKDILESTEKEKIQLMVTTLKPILALNLSFNQTKEVEKILQSVLKEKSIQSIEIKSQLINTKLNKEIGEHTKCHTYTTDIIDPFKSKAIATIDVVHSYEYLATLYEKINKVLIFIFLFAIFVFFIFFISMKEELNALRVIADAFHNYSLKKHVSKIKTDSKSTEIQTITTTANEMIENISSYLVKLEAFNTDLEKQVQEKVERLRSQEKLIVHQSRQAAMGEMLESIAHQWRQPLNIIGLSCANLEMEHDLGVKNDENFKNKMDIISKNINYMSSTIDDFRDFLNPKSKATEFNPKQTIEAVFEILKAQLEHNNISLTINSQEMIEVYGIENEFKQVVFILVNNSKDAIKTLQKENPQYKGEITIDIVNEDANNLISFCDNGGGIKEDIIHSIFDPYFTTKFASSGTGIGLYIAKNIIESRMHARITAQNNSKGCCFKIKQDINVKDNI